MIRALAFAGLITSLAACAYAADAPSPAGASTVVPSPAEIAAGKSRFAGDCALCHTAEPNDGGGGMGPSLQWLFGRPAGTADPNYPYTQALRSARITWDRETLDRYLTAPAQAVPGTAMVISVPEKPARDELIAYFQSLRPQAR